MLEAIPDEEIFKAYPLVSSVDDLIGAGINYIVFYDFTTMVAGNQIWGS